MAFVLIGVLLIVLKLGGFAQFHKDEFWAWAIVLSPFPLAVLWWWFSDSTGLTQKKAMDALDAKKAARREQQMEALAQFRPGAKKKR
ncbi:TIGR04438 family Trp-rich protein [Roseateles sp. DXS20W]|uniref:TIGR04438 family Trp-rich protein n=1 Tax=Pelomonas lactea TaxID=3299030 RepID=A0ABW7GPX3_9BURK